MAQGYVCEVEKTIEGLKNTIEQQNTKIAEMEQVHNAEKARLTAEYEDKISIMQKEHLEEVQEHESTIELLHSHIEQLITDNTIANAQLDIVRMMCGVHE